mgnify:CR=1 FL=1
MLFRSGRNVRVRRFLEKAYARMNAEAREQGVSYTLLDARSAIVYDDDIPPGGKRFRLRDTSVWILRYQ